MYGFNKFQMSDYQSSQRSMASLRGFFVKLERSIENLRFTMLYYIKFGWKRGSGK